MKEINGRVAHYGEKNKQGRANENPADDFHADSCDFPVYTSGNALFVHKVI